MPDDYVPGAKRDRPERPVHEIELGRSRYHAQEALGLAEDAGTAEHPDYVQKALRAVSLIHATLSVAAAQRANAEILLLED